MLIYADKSLQINQNTTKIYHGSRGLMDQWYRGVGLRSMGLGRRVGSRGSVGSGMGVEGGGTTDTSQDSKLRRLKQLNLKIEFP
jgi:hypothetical protein